MMEMKKIYKKPDTEMIQLKLLHPVFQREGDELVNGSKEVEDGPWANDNNVFEEEESEQHTSAWDDWKY